MTGFSPGFHNPPNVQNGKFQNNPMSIEVRAADDGDGVMAAKSS